MAIDNKDKKVLKSSIEREQNELACSVEREKIKGSKNLNVPPLRFPEFCGEWECTSIGNIGEIKNGPFGSVLHAEDYVEEGIPIVTTEHFKTGLMPSDKFGIPQVSNEDYIRLKGYRLETNDIVFSRVGSVDINAHVGIEQNGWLFSGRVLRVRPKHDVDSLFLHYALSTEAVKRDIRNRAVGQTMPSINTPILSSTTIRLPKELSEQKKVAHFLRLLDERIATQNKIIERLKTLIKGFRASLFCLPEEVRPKLRYPQYVEDWSIHKLSDFTKRVTRKNKSLICNNVLTIAAQYGLVSQNEFFNKNVASNNLSGYYLLQKGEFAYNKSYSGDYTWGAIKRLDAFTEGVLSTLYICFSVDENICNSDYLANYFESTKWHEELKNIAGEGARNHGLLYVAVDDFFNTKHRFPSPQEQQHIANTLNCIAAKLDKEQSLLASFSRQRTYLLRSMFV